MLGVVEANKRPGDAYLLSIRSFLRNKRLRDAYLTVHLCSPSADCRPPSPAAVRPRRRATVTELLSLTSHSSAAFRRDRATVTDLIPLCRASPPPAAPIAQQRSINLQNARSLDRHPRNPVESRERVQNLVTIYFLWMQYSRRIGSSCILGFTWLYPRVETGLFITTTHGDT